MPHISIRPEKVFDLFGLPITNSLLLTWVLLGLLMIFAYFFQKSMKEKSSFAVYVRAIIKPLYDLLGSLMNDKINVFFPLLGAFFFFILFSNWFGLIPGVGSLLIKEGSEHIPLFRAPTADLNTTFALALVSVFLIQVYGFKHLGFKYGTKFINIKSPIGLALGLLDIISEFAKILSFSFRLFGNVFAGEVLLVIVAALIPVFASFPFLMLELFVGLIQALVFTMLTGVFISAAINHEEH
jgi:F-type H+-transporting ATPase subunit a